MKETYYFSHDCNARNDEKVLMLRAEHGMEGYGIYWALVEMMFESSDTCLYHNKIKGIAVSYNIDITLLKSVIKTCIDEELFYSDESVFWSESLRRRKGRYHEIKEKKSDAGKKGMAKRWGLDNTVITPLLDSNNTVITKHNKGKEIKLKESKNNTEYDDFVKKLLLKYPGEKTKAIRDKKLPDIIKQYGEEQVIRCVERYSNTVKGTEKKYILNESTFWNGRYLDYLDTNIEESTTVKYKPLEIVYRDEI